MNPYIELPDRAVEMRWVCENSEDDDQIDAVSVSPDFYQESGTPICPTCGDDMSYAGTFLRVGSLRSVAIK